MIWSHIVASTTQPGFMPKDYELLIQDEAPAGLVSLLKEKDYKYY
jgi:hypothetical protein